MTNEIKYIIAGIGTGYYLKTNDEHSNEFGWVTNVYDADRFNTPDDIINFLNTLSIYLEYIEVKTIIV